MEEVMNNKNITLGIGFILVAIIAYQGYLLYQKENPTTQKVTKKEIIKKDEPEINIKIGSAKSPRNNPAQHLSNLSEDERIKLDQKRIEESIQDLFKTIFASKEVQDGLREFKAQAQTGLQELQKELQNLPKQLDQLSNQMQDDPFLSQLFEGLKGISGSSLEDRGDYYYTQIKLVDGKNSKIDISTNDNLLTISIGKKEQKTTKSKNGTITQTSLSSSKNIIALPQDALIEKLQTNYKDDILEITIPKIKASSKS
jgi:HSP20 family molecular chaperone IbpA